MTAIDSPDWMSRSTPERIERARLPLRYSFTTPVNSMRIPRLPWLALGVLLTGCGDPDPEASQTDTPSPSSIDAAAPSSDGSELLRRLDSEGSPTSDNPLDEEAVRVVFLGTSLTEGLGLARASIEAWPARVSDLADSAGVSIRVMNAGLGGETSAGALRRLDWVMQQSPEVLVIETGANDGLRGLPVGQLEANLSEIVRRVQQGYPEVIVVLAQMEAPSNMGADYADAFRSAFRRVADRYQSALIPFLLEGVAGIETLNQGDGRHPTAEGHRMMARNAWPVLEEIFRALRSN